MAYTIVDPQLGFMPISATDAGVTTSGGTAGGTLIPTPPLALGMIVVARDPTYGIGEFILLAGVASTVVGSVVTYNSTSFTTALAPAGANIPQPIAVAMSANVSASTWGWYQISGVAVATKSAVSLASGVAVGIVTASLIGATATGAEVEGAIVAAAVTSADTTVKVMIQRPHMQGRIT